MANAQNISVAVRVRPLTSKEKSRSSWVTVEVLDGKNVLVNDPDDKMGGIDYLRLDKTKTKRYVFDFALGPDTPQEEVYEKTAQSLAKKVVHGYNACVFAYGASGSPNRTRVVTKVQPQGSASKELRLAACSAHLAIESLKFFLEAVVAACDMTECISCQHCAPHTFALRFISPCVAQVFRHASSSYARCCVQLVPARHSP